MNGKNVTRLVLALTLLASVFLRPPGTMLVLDGGTITYEICTGGEMETVTVALGGDTRETFDLGCDFHAAQIGALPFVTLDAAPASSEPTRLAGTMTADLRAGPTGWPLYTPRAPPPVS